MKIKLKEIRDKFKDVNICYIIPSVVFIFIIFYVSAFTLLQNAYSILDSAKRNQLDVMQTCYDVEGLFKTNMYGIAEYVNVWSFSEKTIRENNLIKKIFPEAGWTTNNQGYTLDNGGLIVDGQNKLHFPYYAADLGPCVNSTREYAEYLQGKGIPLCYIQLPNKVLEGYTQLPADGVNVANEMANSYLESVKDISNLNTYDLRQAVIEENLDRDSMFYATDHHWTTGTSFWAFQKIVDYLNKTYGLKIDEEKYYRDIDNYNLTTYEKCFLGSQGKRVGEFVVGVDDYTFIEPKFETNYTLINSAYEEVVIKEGSFRDAVVAREFLEKSDLTTNRHAAYFGGDFGATIIKNNNVDNDLKLLVIKDSFSLPMVAFLSTCVSEIHMVDLRPHDAILPVEYIERYDIDLSLIIYNTEVFGAPMFNFTKR